MCILKFIKMVMLLTPLLLFHSFLGGVPVSYGATEATLPKPNYCETNSLHGQPQEYKEQLSFVCFGVRTFNEGLFDRALEAFNAADKVRLHEAPNYMALSYLALTHAMLDETQLAKLRLHEAYLALLVDGGKIKCSSELDFHILSNQHTKEIPSGAMEAVGLRMCSPLLIHYYGRSEGNNINPLIGEREQVYNLALEFIPNGQALPVN